MTPHRLAPAAAEPQSARRRGYDYGLIRGEAFGLIERPVERSSEPREHVFDHLNQGAFTFANSRQLDPGAAILLRAMAKVLDRLAFLDLGAGCGMGCADASRILQAGRIRHQIMAIGQSPINPFLRCCFRIEQKGGGHESLLQTPHGALESDFGWSVEDLLSLEEAEQMTLFERCRRPFIDRQLVGVFPGEVRPIPGGHDLIYDCVGAFTYAFQHQKQPDALPAVLDGLSVRGAFLHVERVENEKAFAALQECAEPGSLLIADACGLLYLKPQNPLLPRIAAYADAAMPQVGAPAYVCRSLRQFLAAALEDGACCAASDCSR